MKTLLLLLSASLFVVFPYQESPELKEAAELHDSVVKLFQERKFEEAIPLAERIVEIRERLLPKADPLVVAALTNLGDLYMAKGNYNSAKQPFERLLAMLEEKYGPTDSNVAVALDRLAVIHYQLKNMGKSEQMYQRAVEVREKSFGPDDVRVAHALFVQAQFYRYRKDFDRALAGYKRVLMIYSKKNVTTVEIERASKGLYCVAYQSKKSDILDAIEEFRKQLNPAPPPQPRDIINGKAIALGRPTYPDMARIQGISGTVWVLVDIDETGKVISANDMCQGPPYLSESAVKAAYQSRFTPTIVSGVPVKVRGLITFNFVNQTARPY
jgi:TonB family protein